jgi:integrase
LRPDHAQRLYNEELRKGLTPGTLWGIHVVLHGALKQAVQHPLVLQNVTEATAPPMLKRYPIQLLTLSELAAFLKAIAQDRLFPAILLAFGTGLRRGELLALQWKDFNLEGGRVHIHQKLVRIRVHGASEDTKKTRLIF